ncbi:MAG: hypothetical protein A2271_03525 [Candidatus Moranbacteria bacterium RIFOXYA12_FULL_35_19]|nr:MAG: hypothetical protein A2500_06380 [Candidatus Falkowbacteria bacterium RIFOXYC12_FULL_34_55]OGI36254.1 MAG: hypothetical protein A2271_03525 [Candidatus Moranbacteria bacterium RIFOXYA12_FULL_35_19]
MEQSIITMTNKEAERLTIINNLIAEKINGTDASKQLHLSIRQTKRLKSSVIKDGTQGIIHKLRGKVSHNKIEEKLKRKVKKIIKKNYSDFGPTLATEKLMEIHKINLGVTTIRNLMIEEEFFKTKKRKQNQQHRAWRERKECYGEMQQFDGSYHKWLEKRNGNKEVCLLASIDDATGKITKLNFGKNEGVVEVFNFWKDYLQAKNKPVAIYLDKFSTYKVNHKNATDNHELLTQFQRACNDLDINLISAHSPQAKGRIERLFETLQDRLVKELRLQNISDTKTANEFLEETFIQDFNNRFSVVPTKDTNLHKPLTQHDQTNLDKIFSIQSQRQIKNDFTVQFKNIWYQLDEIQPTTVYKKDLVLIEERLDGSIHLSKKEKYLNFKKLPARPEKIKTKLVALTPSKAPWMPPANHPWRKQISAQFEQRQLVHNS